MHLEKQDGNLKSIINTVVDPKVGMSYAEIYKYAMHHIDLPTLQAAKK
jgi:hypothetical protein